MWTSCGDPPISSRNSGTSGLAPMPVAGDTEVVPKGQAIPDQVITSSVPVPATVASVTEVGRLFLWDTSCAPQVAARHVRGFACLTSWISQPFPSGSLNDRYVP